MKSKKILIIGVVVAVVLIAGGLLLWKGGFLRQSVRIAPPGLGILSNKMTDEIYLEAMTELTQYTLEGGSKLTQEDILNETKKAYNNIFIKYGISEEEISRYVQALSEDGVRSAAMQEKLTNIMTELLKAEK